MERRAALGHEAGEQRGRGLDAARVQLLGARVVVGLEVFGVEQVEQGAQAATAARARGLGGRGGALLTREEPATEAVLQVDEAGGRGGALGVAHPDGEQMESVGSSTMPWSRSRSSRTAVRCARPVLASPSPSSVERAVLAASSASSAAACALARALVDEQLQRALDRSSRTETSGSCSGSNRARGRG